MPRPRTSARLLAPLALLAPLLTACGGAEPVPDATTQASVNATTPPPGAVTEPVPVEAATNAGLATTQDAATGTGAADAGAAARYVGRWTGVEGMVLDVKENPAGGVRLAMQYDLDHRGTFDGTITPAGIRFTRDGREQLLRPTNGEATGLKWLAEQSDCLTVREGEGYCRD